jgi:hypothetical protein
VHRARQYELHRHSGVQEMNNNSTYRGVIYGTTIELQQTPDVPNGMEVEVTIKRAELTAEQRKERLNAAFGSCKDDAEDLDSFLDWNNMQRKRNRPELEP